MRAASTLTGTGASGHGGIRQLVAGVIIGALVVAACSNDRKAAPTTTTPTSATADSSIPSGDGPSGPASRLLAVRLSQGHSQAAPTDPAAVLDGDPLTAEQLQAIVGRLPEWQADPDLAAQFRWPAQTLTPPRPGVTVDVPFPPANSQPPVDVPTGPLEVVRHQPDGEVPIAPYVSVTFNQPMVPIGTLGQLDQQSVPATITPALAGRWQWIGTRTLRFDYSTADIDRLPMATEYSVTIPAGSKSATGATLAAAVSWTFATPPITVQSFQPQGDSMQLQPVFVATFDQRIDPAGLLATVTVRAGDETVPVRLATAAEIDADDAARQITQSASEGRWLAFRPAAAMPADTAISVDIGPGSPSAEGPRTSTNAVSYSGHTYAPLRIVRSGCGGPCYPGGGFTIEFNNSLEATSVDPETIGIDPAIAAVATGPTGNVISVSGATQAKTTYTVTIPGSVTDTFGQTLGSEQTVTIDVGAGDPQLQPLQQLITLDPMAPTQSIPVMSIGHDSLRLRVFDVQPSDWPAFESYLNSRDSSEPPKLPSWKVLVDSVVDVQGDTSQFAETPIDLGRVFSGKPGHVVVIVEPTTEYGINSNLYYQNRPAVAWVQSTLIGVDAVSDSDNVVVWTTDLRNGAALAGAAIGLADASGTTDADGLATLALPAANGSAPSHLVATRGDDSAILSGGYWQRQPKADEARWFTFTDRGTYRPGETAKIKGWVRHLTLTGDAQLQRLQAGAEVAWTLNDAQGIVLGSGSAPLTSLGGFEISAAIADGANLGQAYLSLSIAGDAALASQGTTQLLDIEEFRRPEFEVIARPESTGPFTGARPATVAADANYYAGGPLGAAPVTWRVRTAAATYSPPHWDQFTFGIWTPWWQSSSANVGLGRGPASFPNGALIDGPTDVCCFPQPDVSDETFTGITDGTGHHFMQIDFAGADGALPDLPVAVTAEATVTDVNRQAWSSQTSLLVHPAEFYVGLRSARTFVRPGEAMDIAVIVTDVDGNAVAGRPITVTAERMQSKFANGQWTEVAVDAQTCDTTSAADEVTCTFKATEGGTYRITSVVADDNGGRSRTELTRWVSGGEAHPARNVAQEELTIVPDKATYAPGDTAELLVQSPFATGEGLLTVTRNGIRSTSRFAVAEGSAVVQIAVADHDIPNLDVSIEVVGAATRIGDDGTALPDAPQRPAFAVGALSLSIPPVSRTLTVTRWPRRGPRRRSQSRWSTPPARRWRAPSSAWSWSTRRCSP
jgi:alpha-2-macroglobulin